MGGRGFGVLGNIVVGVLGALVGGFLGSTFFGWDVTGGGTLDGSSGAGRASARGAT